MKRRVPLTVGSACAVVGIILATASEALSGFEVSVWLTVTLIVVGGGVAIVAIVTEGLARREQRRAEVRKSIRWFTTALPQMRSVDPFRVGVTRSRIAEALSGTQGVRPPYVSRNIDRQVDNALREARFILIYGASKVGKSRTAFEALQRVWPDSDVIVPVAPASLPDALIESQEIQLSMPTILWLDDLDTYLETGPMTATLLERVIDEQPELRIVATIRTPSLARLRHGDDFSAQSNRRLLDMARGVELGSSPETWNMQQANELYPGADFRELGLGGFFSAVGELLDKYGAAGDAGPAYEATLWAAIDWRRCGVTRPIPRESLEGLARTFLAGADPGTLNFGQAIAWANEPVSSGMRLITYIEDGEVTGFEAADSLIDLDELRRPIEDATWNAVIAAAESGELLNVARSSYLRGETRANHAALLKAQEASDPTVSTWATYNLGAFLTHRASVMLSMNLGNLAIAREDRAEAQKLFEQASENGHPLAELALGWLHYGEGRRNEAEHHLRRAASNGDPFIQLELARFLIVEHKKAEGEACLRAAYETGYPQAAVALGTYLLRSDERVAEGEAILRSALDEGVPDAGLAFAHYLLERGETDRALGVLRQTASLGHPPAYHALGSVLVELGEVDEAEAAYRQAAAAGSLEAANNLAALLLDQGQSEEAEEWLLRAATAGSAAAAGNLGIVAHERGDDVTAEQWFRRGAAMGDAKAAFNLATILVEQGRDDEAEPWVRLSVQAGLVPDVIEAVESPLRAQAEAGDMDAAYQLGRGLRDRGEFDQAEQWLLVAARAGHRSAANTLGQLYLRQGNEAAAEKWYRVSAEAGEAEAAVNLGNLMSAQGKLDEAVRWHTVALEAGVLLAAMNMALAVEKQGDLGRAEELLRMAATGDHVYRRVAAYNLAKFLERNGRPDEAAHWLRIFGEE